jgi:hypothetical protein
MTGPRASVLGWGLATLLVPSACTDRPENVPAGTSTFTVRDSAGVEIVDNGRAGPWADSALEALQVREVLRIGVEYIVSYEIDGALS